MFIPQKTQCCMDWHSENKPIQNVCAYFEGTKIIRRIDDNSVSDQLLIAVNNRNKNKYEFTVPVEQLVDLPALLSACVANKLTLHHYMQHGLSQYLMDCYRECEASGKIEYRHNRLGWFEANGKQNFLMQTNDVNGSVSKCARPDFKFRKGDEQVYKQFLADTVYPVPTLALAMAIGYSAPLVSLLREDYDFGSTVIVNLCGASSTGKTTVSQLMVSPFACPTISNKDGLIRTFHSTANALFAGIDNIHGLPLVLDDVTTNPNISLPNLIYTLASGEDKARCNSDGNLRNDHDGWSGVAVISSETPIEDTSCQNQGLKVRVLQTQGITWTPDAKTAEYIKSVVQKNYGFTGKEFAEFISKIPHEKLCLVFDQAQEKVHSLMIERDNLSDRLETKYSAIYLTIALMNKCFGLKLNADELINILLKPEQDSVADRDISLKALNLVREFIIQKRSHFCEVHEQKTPEACDRQAMGDKYGVIRSYGRSLDVFITPSIVGDLLKRNGIQEVATVKNRWKEKGIIACDNGRLSTKYLGIRYVRFIFSGGELDPFTEELMKSKNNAVAVQSQDNKPLETITVENKSLDLSDIFGV